MASTSFSFTTQLTHTRREKNFSTARSSPARYNPDRPFNVVSASLKLNSSLQMASSSSLYEVLGVQTGATCQEIKSAYRKLAKVLHPDTRSSNDDDDRETSDEFILVHSAYATLSDPEKRAMYDVSLFRRRRVAVTGAAPTRQRRRNWETDQCW